MARPKTGFPPAAAIRALMDEEGKVTVRVTPNANADAVQLGGTVAALSVRTTAPPEDGKANEAVLQLLAFALNQPRSSLTLVRGATNRVKLVRCNAS